MSDWLTLPEINLQFPDIGKYFQDLFDGMWSSITSTIDGVISAITGAINGLFSGIGDFFTGIFSGISSFFSGLVDGISAAITGFFDGMGEILSSWFSGIVGLVADLWWVAIPVVVVGGAIVWFVFIRDPRKHPTNYDRISREASRGTRQLIGGGQDLGKGMLKGGLR
jgi:Flp pilus assembly pilin Flp